MNAHAKSILLVPQNISLILLLKEIIEQKAM